MLLKMGSAQSLKPETIYGPLPSKKFIDRKAVAPASIFQANQTPIHGSHKVRFVTDDPAPIICRWEVGQRQWTAV
jgi:hypothetical protein